MEGLLQPSSPQGRDPSSDSTAPLLAPREKSKRPQLSCNACRARKVKCDRVQPCTACSLHQIAELCHYDLTEAERHPILQAEALREKDKEIARLRDEVQQLGGQPIKSEFPGIEDEKHSNRKAGPAPRVPKKPQSLRQKRRRKGEPGENVFFGSPSLANIIEEFANLTIQSKTNTSYPFPTLWTAREGTSGLVNLLPEKEEVFKYLGYFRHRALALSFPYLPNFCTNGEVERFMSNLEHNAHMYPDHLALLFATLAQGLQHGVYDQYGEQWVAGAMEEETKKGDVFVAAAMQALRLASYTNRPTLSVIETLMMIGPYLIDSGKFIDAWALFGVTVRLAQAVNLHRDPSQLGNASSNEESITRKTLWWWMLHTDQQYSMAMGRPLGIANMGDCPAFRPMVRDPLAQSLENYACQFTILAREILSAGYLSLTQIDNFAIQLLSLRMVLPEAVRFDRSWLHDENSVPRWPMDAQAASFHAKLHNFVIMLNRQRALTTRIDTRDSGIDLFMDPAIYEENTGPRGHERMLESCRETLYVFEFFNTRVRAGVVCWTLCQQAFNAAMLLAMSTLDKGESKDLVLVQQAFGAFSQMHALGVHQLAGAAVDQLRDLSKSCVQPPLTEAFMGKPGMILLEDLDSHCSHTARRSVSSPTFPKAWTFLQQMGHAAAEWELDSLDLGPQPTPKRQKRKPQGTKSAIKPKVPPKKPSLALHRHQSQLSAPQRAVNRTSGIWMHVDWPLGRTIGTPPSSTQHHMQPHFEAPKTNPPPTLDFSAQTQSLPQTLSLHPPHTPLNTAPTSSPNTSTESPSTTATTDTLSFNTPAPVTFRRTASFARLGADPQSWRLLGGDAGHRAAGPGSGFGQFGPGPAGSDGLGARLGSGTGITGSVADEGGASQSFFEGSYATGDDGDGLEGGLGGGMGTGLDGGLGPGAEHGLGLGEREARYFWQTQYVGFGDWS